MVAQAKADKAREVAELAAPLVQALHGYQLPDADMRALQPYTRRPAQENTGEPQDSVSFIGPLSTQTAFGERITGQTVGQVEAIVAELVSLAARYEQGDVTVVGPVPDEDEGAA
jgi:hypothetical protein